MDLTRRLPGRVVSAACFVALLAATASCARIEAVFEEPAPPPATPHEAYLASLDGAGLGRTALAERWLAAATEALEAPVAVDPPFEELSFYPAEEPTATGYRFSVDRGQRIHVQFAADPPTAARVFMDLYRIDAAGERVHVAHGVEGSTVLEFEPSAEGEFLLRVQPELLADVRLRLRLVRAAVLAFPVLDHDTGDIMSFFGAARDGGRREHHGIDIFAPRGTPVVAAADGVVRRVGDQRLGGKVVWLRDSKRGTSQYYAHLDAQLVRRGQRVRAGDTLGLVGNTGNARTTPPHLHFGIYQRRRGPIDPYDYLHRPPQDPPRLRADTTGLGRWARTSAAARGTLAGTDTTFQAERHTVLRVLGAFGSDLRVRLPDGRSAIVSGVRVEPLDGPIDEARLAAGQSVLAEPLPGATPRGPVAAEAALPVLGRFEDYVLVQSASGERGWVRPSR